MDPITVNGATISWQEAEKVAAEVAARKAAQPVIEEGRLYWAPNDGSDKLCRWRFKDGEYRMSTDGGATSWPVRCPETMKRGVARGDLIPYTPEVGVVYRHEETSEEAPYTGRIPRYLYRLRDDGTWERRWYSDTSEQWCPTSGVADDIAFGRRIPYRGWTEEIAAATRIVPKVGMIIQHKQTGAVYRYYRATGWLRVDEVGSVGQAYIPYPTTTTYTLLPRYTFEGVQ